MGLGDDIMATAYARELAPSYPGHKFVYGVSGEFHDPVTGKLRVHWSEVFENNPLILQPGEQADAIVCIDDYPGRRRYLDYTKCTSDHFEFVPTFKAPIGNLYFSAAEMDWAHGFIARTLAIDTIFVEPCVKTLFSADNKQWPHERWQAVVDHTVYEVAQFVHPFTTFKLRNAHHLEVPSFRHACAIMRAHFEATHMPTCVACTDGGLHHAAAALRLPALVIWGGYSSPEILGYEDHVNLWHGDGPYGDLRSTPRCRDAIAKVTVDEVCSALDELLR